ncbi:MAG TPA: hypothetical protein VGF17_07590, partial [Phytomonospora sp.]
WRAVKQPGMVELEVVHDVDKGGDGDLVDDEPLSFNPEHRRYTSRRTARTPVTVINPHAAPAPAPTDPHDPFAALAVLEEE